MYNMKVDSMWAEMKVKKIPVLMFYVGQLFFYSLCTQNIDKKEIGVKKTMLL